MSLPTLPELRTMSGVNELITDFAEFKHIEKQEGEKSLSFLVYKTAGNAEIFDLIANKESIIFENEVYVIDVCERTPIGNTVEKYVEARHEMFTRLRGQFYEELHTGALRIERCLDIAFAGSGLTYEVIGTFASREFENFGRDRGLKLFQYTMQRFETEYRVVGKHIIVSTQIARETDAQVRHGHNLQSISEHIDTNELATFIKGFSYDDETGDLLAYAEYESPNSHLYTDENGRKKIIHAEYVYDNTFRHNDALKQRLIKVLKDVPDYNLVTTYEELKRNGIKLHDIRLGDFIWVVHEVLKLDIKARVISVERYPYEPVKSPVIELGNYRRDSIKDQAALQESAKRVEINERELIVVRKNANQAVESARRANEMASGINGDLNSHINDMTRHVTSEQVRRWDSNPSSGEVDADIKEVRDAVDAVDQKVNSIQTIANNALTQANNRNRSRALFIGDGTQTVFTLPFSYTVGRNQLDVYVGYTKRISGTPAASLPIGFVPDYNETSATQISFTDAPPIDAPIEVLIREVSS